MHIFFHFLKHHLIKVQIIVGHNRGNCKEIKGKSIASQNIEIGQTSGERPQLIAAITIEFEEIDDKSMPLHRLQKHQKGTKQIASKKKKI